MLAVVSIAVTADKQRCISGSYSCSYRKSQISRLYIHCTSYCTLICGCSTSNIVLLFTLSGDSGSGSGSGSGLSYGNSSKSSGHSKNSTLRISNSRTGSGSSEDNQPGMYQ